MGFSRTQAVVALEQYDYDVQRALNSLLGGEVYIISSPHGAYLTQNSPQDNDRLLRAKDNV